MLFYAALKGSASAGCSASVARDRVIIRVKFWDARILRKPA